MIEQVNIVKPDGSKYKALVVDDSAFTLKQITQILMSAGIEVVGNAPRGEDAIRMYKELYPNVDFMTLDITMPDIDGLQVLKEILSFDKNAKIIMVTALGREDIVKTAIMNGAKGFILKPLDRLKVLERIKAILGA
ncbi:MAG: response regulator [Spirochaetia bacterium]|nr:response regulator [Spirochaetota bacterium]MDW8112556.1 response regulator [Spirochaetia bacterium]